MSAHEGSEWQVRQQARRIDADKPGLVVGHPAFVPGAPKVGTRSIVLEISEAEIRRLAGAPEDAVVEMRPGREVGPNGLDGRDPGTVVIKWKER